MKDIVGQGTAVREDPGGTQARADGTQVRAAELRAAELMGAELMGAVPGGADGAAELMGAVSAVKRTARRAARLVWREEPLAPAQSELLRLATARPGISVAEAAHELRLAPNTVSTLVGRLAAAGLLDRGRATSDGRSVRLTVTDKASQRMAGWRDLRAEVAARALDRLTERDRKALADAVPALLRFAGELEKEAP